ncbi:MAG: GNAT family N-acetyltransferase [Haloferacaceae archaeon]
MDVQFDLLGWPDDGPTLDLDHRRFAYAGKFVMSDTGKAVARAVGGREGRDDPDGADAAGADGDGGGADADGAVGPAGEDPLAGGTGDGPVVGAVAFDADRTDPAVLRLRYVTVRDDRRGERVGPRLCGFVARRARDRGFERVLIAVNNPFAYAALYRAGFGYTGERTGIAELVLERPDPTGRDPERYRAGLAAFGDRDLPDEAAAFVAERRDGTPPDRIAE